MEKFKEQLENNKLWNKNKFYKYIKFEDKKNYNSILGIEINDYNFEEIYSVRCGPQNDGTDYYVYKFNQNKQNEINKELKNNQYWSKEKLNDNILNSFKYNEEVKLIKNGYYHYEKVCRTSNLNKIRSSCL